MQSRRPRVGMALDTKQIEFRTENDVPRFNQYALMRIAPWPLGFVAALLFASGIWIEPTPEPYPASSRTAEQDLLETLQSLRMAADAPAERRILDEARQARERLEQPLRELCAVDDHRLLEQGVQAVGALGLVDLRPRLLELIDGEAEESVRVAAIAAADQLAPWSSDELFGFLTLGSSAEQIAALARMPGRSTPAPWEQALALLVEGDDEVRAAAMAAIPRQPPPRAMRGILALLRSDDVPTVVAGLHALARTEYVASYERQVTDLLASGDASVQVAALEVLALKGEPVAEPQVVWALALDRGIDARVRRHAMHCLERSGGFDADSIELAASGLEPLVAYFAARCLLSVGRASGVEVLIGLLGGPPSDAVNAARGLLSELTGLRADASAEAFRRAMAGVALPLASLPAPAIRF